MSLKDIFPYYVTELFSFDGFQDTSEEQFYGESSSSEDDGMFWFLFLDYLNFKTFYTCELFLYLPRQSWAMCYFHVAISNHLSEKPNICLCFIWLLNTGLTVHWCLECYLQFSLHLSYFRKDFQMLLKVHKGEYTFTLCTE